MGKITANIQISDGDLKREIERIVAAINAAGSVTVGGKKLSFPTKTINIFDDPTKVTNLSKEWLNFYNPETKEVSPELRGWTPTPNNKIYLNTKFHLTDPDNKTWPEIFAHELTHALFQGIAGSNNELHLREFYEVELEIGKIVGVPMPDSEVEKLNERRRQDGLEIEPLKQKYGVDPGSTNSIPQVNDEEIYQIVNLDIGDIFGGRGDDALLSFGPQFIKNGDVIDLAKILTDLPIEFENEIADENLFLTLDGGAGDDWIVVIGGTGAVTIGGEGKDFLYNSSYKGQLYGDTIDGTGERSTDVFWWSAGSFIMDAGPEDILQFFGLPLTGGTGVKHETGEQWAYDWVLPFIRYGLSDSGQLIVQSSLSNILNHTLRSSPNDDILRSSMIVENFDQGAGGDWAHIARGDLGMTFRIWDFNASEKFGGFESVWGMLINRLDALKDFGKMLKWVSADDPLVLDLDGDGIETTSVSQGGVHFDFNGDHFAELSGWVGADDGFLVLDRDGNGRIDDISELFGAPGGSGFANDNYLIARAAA